MKEIVMSIVELGNAREETKFFEPIGEFIDDEINMTYWP
jgi:hypothetical protein